MNLRYRICTVRGDLRNATDPGTDSYMDAVKAAEAMVQSGSAFPGLTVWEWTNGSKAATITPQGTQLHEH